MEEKDLYNKPALLSDYTYDVLKTIAGIILLTIVIAYLGYCF